MRKKRRSAPVWLDSQAPLAQWYSTSLGQCIAQRLEYELEQRLTGVFGYQGLQVGNLVPGMHLLAGAGLQRHLLLDAPDNEPEVQQCDPLQVPADDQLNTQPEVQQRTQTSAHSGYSRQDTQADTRVGTPVESPLRSPLQSPMKSRPGFQPDIKADVLSLPIASGTMKAVAFFHTLDFCDQPHQALREANRVLTDDGQLIIVGFNPYSAFGARHALTAWRRREPWNGRFYARHRVSDWLSVLDYQVLDSSAIFMRPPINSERLMRRLGRMEGLHRWIGGVGGLYIMRARKQTIPMTMVRQWTRRKRTGLTAGSFARTASKTAARPLATVARIDSRK